MNVARSILLSFAIVAALGDRIFADETITLPLQGYFHVGRYMPVRIPSAKDGQTIQGSGILPVRIQTNRPPTDQIVPVLMISANAALATPEKLHPLDMQQRLVGLVGSAGESDARHLFRDRDVIPVHLDWPLGTAAYAWEALDAIVIADAPPPDDATIVQLLGAGVVFCVRAADAPDTRWPWRREGEFWMLRYEPLGPRDCFAEPSAMLASYEPGVPDLSRRNIVILAAMFAIVILGATLLRGKKRMIAIAGVAVGAYVAIYAWIDIQPTHRSAGGEVSVISADLWQQDFWSFQADLRPGVARMNAGVARPMLADWNSPTAAGMTLIWRDDGQVPLFEYQTSPGMKMAFLSRLVMPRGNAVFPVNNLHHSPLRLVVDETYLKNGAHLIGEGPDYPPKPGDTFDNWPVICIEAAKEKG